MTRTKTEILSHISDEIIKSKIVANNTIRIFYKDGREAIRLHDTDVVTKLPPNGKFIILSSGGRRTPTTKDRINTFSPARVVQEKGVWYVGGSVFYDGITIDADGKPTGKVKAVNLGKIERVKKRIAKFVRQITEDNLPLPSSGDCWLCGLRTADGVSMGDCFGRQDNEHIELHIKENYLHGSLLVNAMRAAGLTDEQIRLHYAWKLTGRFRRALRRYLQRRLIPEYAGR